MTYITGSKALLTLSFSLTFVILFFGVSKILTLYSYACYICKNVCLSFFGNSVCGSKTD